MNKYLEYFALFFTICGINILNIIFPFFNYVYLIPIFFLLFFLSNIKSFKISTLIFPILFLAIWGIIPSITAEVSVSTAFTEHRGLIFVLLYIFIIYWYGNQSMRNVINIFDLHIITFFIAIVYVFSSQEILDFQSRGRLQSDLTGEYILNANSIGYLSFVAIISSVSKFILNKNTKTFLLIMLIMLLSIIGVTLSASRAGTIIIFLLLIQFYFYSYSTFSKNQFINFILMITITLSAAIFLLSTIISFFQNTFLFDRFDADIFNDLRYLHLIESLKIISQNPIFGVGPGNYQLVNSPIFNGTFSHNSFTEITLSYGIFGLFAYLYFIYNFFKIKSNSKELSFLKMFFFPSFIIYNFFYVIYLTPLFMGLIMNFFLFLQKLYQSKNLSR